MDFLEQAKDFQTPLGIVALVLVGIFALYRIVLTQIDPKILKGNQVFQLIRTAMNYFFALALVIVVIYAAVYLADRVIGSRAAVDIGAAVAALQGTSDLDRINAIHNLRNAQQANPGARKQICDALTQFVRENNPRDDRVVRSVMPKDAALAIETLSGAVRLGHCGNLDLRQTNLRRLQLEGATLRGANLTDAWLDEATLIDADLSGASMIGVTLEETTLSKARFSGAKLDRATFQGTDLRDAHFEAAGGMAAASGLAAADLTRTRLGGAVLDGVDLSRARLPTGTPMAGVSLKGTNLAGVDLRNVRGLCAATLAAALTNAETRPPTGFSC